MSYKSLLFCVDEKAARLVTQVLSELDFTVELATETYATAKRLAEEHFDALVVDCENEQDASVLFKAARNSAENHSSLSVAVVDGQAGVAKAFRIGANLVLTKPINVEQSKGTLRVARGLLKKNQTKPAGSAANSAPASTFVSPSPKPVSAAPTFNTPSSSSLPPAFTPLAPAAAAAHASAPAVPYAALQVDKEPEPATQAADVAVLESLPHLPVAKPAEPASAALTSLGLDKPFVVSSSAAAAAAPAVEKKIVERSAGSFSPLVTNEPIIREATAPTPFEMHAPVPTFSTLDSRRKDSSGALGIFKTIVAFGLLGVAFYLGWQKLPGVLQNHHFSWPHKASKQTEPQKIGDPAQPTAAQTDAAAAVPATTPAAAETTSTPATPTSSAGEQIAAGAPSEATTTASSEGNVEVQEMPMARDAKITVTAQPKPLVVKNYDSRASGRPAASAPVAPSLSLANAGTSSPIADLVTSDAPLPKPVPGTIRISQGVSQGLLMKKVTPVYPPMAIQFHKEGTVEMLATIDTEGAISNVKVLSGDPMLVRAAVDAVKRWEYRPYLLNGQPLSVETQISISFKLPR